MSTEIKTVYEKLPVFVWDCPNCSKRFRDFSRKALVNNVDRHLGAEEKEQLKRSSYQAKVKNITKASRRIS